MKFSIVPKESVSIPSSNNKDFNFLSQHEINQWCEMITEENIRLIKDALKDLDEEKY